jgi:hypothetical protein
MSCCCVGRLIRVCVCACACRAGHAAGAPYEYPGEAVPRWSAQGAGAAAAAATRQVAPSRPAPHERKTATPAKSKHVEVPFSLPLGSCLRTGVRVVLVEPNVFFCDAPGVDHVRHAVRDLLPHVHGRTDLAGEAQHGPTRHSTAQHRWAQYALQCTCHGHLARTSTSHASALCASTASACAHIERRIRAFMMAGLGAAQP